MSKIIEIQVPDKDGNLISYVNVYYSDEGYYSMPKTVYDEQQAALAKLEAPKK